MKSVLVLIPFYEDLEALTGCLESLRDADLGGADVLVVDDASGGGLAEQVRESFPEVELLVQQRNLGFAGTCNAGFELAIERGVEHILLLNQDTRIAPDMLVELAEVSRAHPGAGIVAPRTFSFVKGPDGRERVLYAGSWSTWLPLRQRIPGIERAEGPGPSEPVPTDHAWGHGMWLRTSLLREIGGFDQAFPMYYEDLDLCRRARRAGYEILYAPKAVMWHDIVDGARASGSEPWRWAHKVRSTAIFHRKHFGRAGSLFLTPLTYLAELAQLARQGKLRAALHLAVEALRGPWW